MKTVNKKLLNVCTPILNQLIHRLLPETLNTIIILAGFLTYFAFEHPSHFHSKQWIRVLPKTLMKLTAAGLFRIHTGFPFHPPNGGHLGATILYFFRRPHYSTGKGPVNCAEVPILYSF